MPTSSTDRKKSSGTNEKASETVSLCVSSFQEGPSQLETFDPKIHEAHVLKTASETTIIDSMIFEDHSKLDLSSIHSRSQDDSSHCSDSTDDLSLHNWTDN